MRLVRGCSFCNIFVLKGEVDGGTAIPSESSILAAKQKRERLRSTKTPNEDDFVSLSVAKRDDTPSGPHPESRLVREEDEIGEGDDGKFLLCISDPEANTGYRVCRIH